MKFDTLLRRARQIQRGGTGGKGPSVSGAGTVERASTQGRRRKGAAPQPQQDTGVAVLPQTVLPQPEVAVALDTDGMDFDALIKTPAGRRYLSAVSPEFFDAYYCNMDAAPHRSRWFETLEERFNLARKTNRKQRCLFLAPRGHGKTEASVSFITRRVCLDRNIRILLVCASSTNAKDRLAKVKALLRSPKIVEDWCSAPEDGFGPFLDSEDQIWTADKIVVARTDISIHPTIGAVGTGSKVTGGHFHIVLCDDIEDEETVATLIQRQKTKKWLAGTLSPMCLRNGILVFIGTRKHDDDCYADMKANPMYFVIEDKAVIEWPIDFGFEMVTVNGREEAGEIWMRGDREPVVLWEDRPFDMLMRERLTIGPSVFGREFQHEVISDDTAAVRWEYLEAALKRGELLSLYPGNESGGPGSAVDGGGVGEVGWTSRLLRELDIVQGIDLALVTDVKAAEARDTDYTVIVTLGRDRRNGDRYLMGLARARGISEEQFADMVHWEYMRFLYVGLPPRVVAIEKNNFGIMKLNNLLADRRFANVPLAGHLTTSAGKADVWTGLPAIRSAFECGRVVLPSKGVVSAEMSGILADEIHSLGRAKHDDCAMSWWIAESQFLTLGDVAPMTPYVRLLREGRDEGDRGEEDEGDRGEVEAGLPEVGNRYAEPVVVPDVWPIGTTCPAGLPFEEATRIMRTPGFKMRIEKGVMRRVM